MVYLPEKICFEKEKNQSLTTTLYETQVGRIRLQANGYQQQYLHLRLC